MRRSPLELLSPAKLRQLAWIPRAIGMFKDWRPLLLNWSGLTDAPQSYRLRDGGVMETSEGIDAATVGVVFVRRDYGPIDRDWRVILDIGANIGSFTVMAARSAPNARVLAFEPMPQTFSTLARNVEANRLGGRVEAQPMGVACATESRELHVAGNTVFNSLYADTGHTVPIDCISLADVFARFGLDHVDLMKIDCEGAEYEILYDAPEGLLRVIDRVRMEYHREPGVAGGTIEELSDHLAANGFDRTFFRSDNPTSGIAWFERAGAAKEA